MTDNRTTELREKLDALGIEHTDASYKRHIPITAWTADGVTFCYVEGFESTDLHIDNATPEQAIAATLDAPINEATGKPFDFSKLADRLDSDKDATLRSGKPFSDAIANLRKTVREAFSRESVSILVEGYDIMRAIDEVETATLGSGTLTAEQVRETVEKHWHDLPAEYDMPEATALPEYSYDWQAIADELNNRCGYELTPDGLPVGLTISEDGNLLDWRGENYVRQSTLGSGECAKCAEGFGAYADSLCDPLKEQMDKLIRCLENDYGVKASWDGLRKVWLTEAIEPRDGTAAALGRGECKWIWAEEWTDTDAGRECDYAHWTLDCGCWDEYDERFQDYDDYERKPEGVNFCERCGRAVKR